MYELQDKEARILVIQCASDLLYIR